MTVRSLVAILLATALVSGCSSIGQSRFNPLNWFGSEEEALDYLAAVEKQMGLPTVDPVRTGVARLVDAL